MGVDNSLTRDVRHAVRRAIRNPLFSALVILCIAAGVGSTVGAYAVVSDVLLKPLPFADTDRLYDVSAFDVDREDSTQRYWVSIETWETVRRRVSAFESLGGFILTDLDVVEDGVTERVQGARIVPGAFETLGVSTLLGRTPDDDDYRARRRVALISEGMWKTRFGGHPGVLGRPIVVEGIAHEVIGVMPSSVRYPFRARLWTVLVPEDYTERERVTAGQMHVVGRLAPGAGTGDLEAQLQGALSDLAARHPDFFTGDGLESWPLARVLTGAFRAPLLALLVAAGFVLAIAVANVGNLLLVRSQSQLGGRAMRTALGATRADLVRQTFTGSFLLAGVGGLVGVLGASQLLPALLSLAPVNDPAFDEVALGVGTGGVALALVLVVAVIMTLLSGVATGGGDPDALQRVLVRGTDSPSQRKAQGLFVTGQLAVSVMLVVTGGLMARSFLNLQEVDPGFDPEGLAAFRVSTPASLADTHEGRVGFVREVSKTLASVPGVTSVGAAQRLPLDDLEWGYAASVEEFPPEVAERSENVTGLVVAPGFFETLGVELLAGRTFQDFDGLRATPVAMVSRAFQEHYWPEGSALGKRIKRGSYSGDRPWMEIVGVVDDIRSGGLGEEPGPTLYYNNGQIDDGYISVMVMVARVEGDPAAMLPVFRDRVLEVGPSATVFQATTGPRVVETALGRARFNGVVVMALALVGVLLATAGVYGVTAFAVGRRTRELALRMALGAPRAHVTGRVLAGALTLAVGGAAVGLLGAFGLSVGVLSELLFDVDPFAPGTYGLAALVVIVLSVAASWLPARRATRIDPAIALKEECKC